MERVEGMIQKKLVEFHPYKVNDCELIMRNEDLTYVICCMSEKNIIYKCDKTTFTQNEYVGVQANLRKLNKYFDSYYACVYSDLPIFETHYPAKYNYTPRKVMEPSLVCGGTFYREDYHNVALSGFVSGQKGIYSVLTIYLFNGSYPADFNFSDNLELGIKALDLKGGIR